MEVPFEQHPVYQILPSDNVDTIKSVLIPNVPMYRFPLWICHLTAEIACASRKLQAWRDAVKWLMQPADCSAVNVLAAIQQCKSHLYEIPWDCSVQYKLLSNPCPLTTLCLENFLSSDWLSDSQLDAGLAVIQRELGVTDQFSNL